MLSCALYGGRRRSGRLTVIAVTLGGGRGGWKRTWWRAGSEAMYVR